VYGCYAEVIETEIGHDAEVRMEIVATPPPILNPVSKRPSLCLAGSVKPPPTLRQFARILREAGAAQHKRHRSGDIKHTCKSHDRLLF
jgi:hypothetical protein